MAERTGITEDDERRLDVQGNTIRFTPQSFCGDFETLCSFSEEYCGRSQLLEASELLRGGKLFQKERKENRKREGNQ